MTGGTSTSFGWKLPSRSLQEPPLGSVACDALGITSGSNLLYLAAQCGLDRTCDLLVQILGSWVPVRRRSISTFRITFPVVKMPNNQQAVTENV